jgi:hypothetical protein
VPLPPPAQPEKVPPPPPEEVPPPPPAEVKPPPPEEVKPPRCKVARKLVVSPACSFSKCVGCLLVSEDVPPGFPESWKGGRSSRGPTTHSSTAYDHDGLRLLDQCLS